MLGSKMAQTKPPNGLVDDAAAAGASFDEPRGRGHWVALGINGFRACGRVVGRRAGAWYLFNISRLKPGSGCTMKIRASNSTTGEATGRFEETEAGMPSFGRRFRLTHESGSQGSRRR